MTVRRFLTAGLMLTLVVIAACGRSPHEVKITGRTMGTTYLVKVVADDAVDRAALKRRIDARLEDINRSMSTYRPDSDISRFNAMTAADVPVMVSADFVAVMAVARRLYEITDGAWDGTVRPLVNLWGFGGDARPRQVPPTEAIAAALKEIGFHHIRIHDSGALSKGIAHLSLDLASIAKGYGVDAVAGTLRKAGYGDFLVEIGGEVYAAGHRIDGTPWRVGINLPDPDATANKVFRAVRLENRALATSGDYRNFFVQAGRRYSHILDPRTGRPVINGVVSVSVLADNCTLADGLATGVMVMGAAAGLDLMSRLPRVEGFIIEKGPDGGLLTHATDGFPPALKGPEGDRS